MCKSYSYITQQAVAWEDKISITTSQNAMYYGGEPMVSYIELHINTCSQNARVVNLQAVSLFMNQRC